MREEMKMQEEVKSRKEIKMQEEAKSREEIKMQEEVKSRKEIKVQEEVKMWKGTKMEDGKKSQGGLTGSSLKWIALVSMLADHICAVLLEPVALQSLDYELYQGISLIRLSLGRIAFPIFCFLLVEGFFHTRDRKRYACNLGIFALLSELPFDLAFRTGVTWEYQNVFFTLLIALLTMWVCEWVKERYGRCRWSLPVRIGIGLVGMLTADLLKTDYAGYGVICILFLYFLRGNKLKQTLITSLVFVVGNPSELLAPIGLCISALYNGKRGLKLKYLFYIFYPLHLLILYGIRCYMIPR